jgi:hypothetical protein
MAQRYRSTKSKLKLYEYGSLWVRVVCFEDYFNLSQVSAGDDEVETRSLLANEVARPDMLRQL